MPESPVSQVAPTGRSETITVAPVRHPGRWIGVAVVACVVAWLVTVLVTAEALEWGVVRHYLFDAAVLRGVVATLEMTALAMVVGIVLGTLIAIMRLSPNPLLRSVAALYQWFFRGTPTLVQLVFWFNLATLFPRITVGVGGTDFFSLDTNQVMTPFVASLLGLGLNFSAYYSEIVRAGILSVDEGQTDAAAAYGLRRLQALRYIVLPQAMRVIIPPTGNETIGMLKWTSLASVVAYTELLHSVGVIYSTTFEVIPLLVVAALWYLFLTSILSIGQLFIEKRFARGTRRNPQTSWMEKAVARTRRGKR